MYKTEEAKEKRILKKYKTIQQRAGNEYWFIILLLLVFFITVSEAQNNHVSAITKKIAVMVQDTNRVNELMELSDMYLDSRPDTALLLTQESVALSRKLKYKVGEIKSLNGLGNIFMVMGDYPKSLENFIEALKISATINDLRRQALIINNIGLLNGYQDDHELALTHFFASKIIAESIHNDEAKLISVINIGDSYEKLNKLDSARVYTQQAYELAVRLNKIDSRGIALNNLGNIHSKMGQPIIAMEYYRLSIIDFTAENDDEGICEDALGMANIFKKINEPDSMLKYAHMSINAATRGGFTKSILSAGNFLLEYFETIKQTDSAYAYQKITIAAKETLYSTEKSRQLQSLIFAEKIRQQEMATAKALAYTTRKRNIQMAGIGTFIPVFFGTILFFGKRKIKPKSIEVIGMLGLLFFFEFVFLLAGPFIDSLSQHSTILLFCIQIIVALILIPLHNKLELLVKHKFVNSVV